MFATHTEEPTPTVELNSLYDISINRIDGVPIDLGDFKGKKILFVNVASFCSFTDQYKALQKIHEQYGAELVVIGLPCNQFGKKEPGTEDDIQDFCETHYGIDFLMTEKIDVRGGNKHPLYRWLTEKKFNGVKDSSVKWNFQKYLVDEEGNWVHFWYSLIEPDSEKILRYFKKGTVTG